MERLSLLRPDELPDHFEVEDQFSEAFREESRVLGRGERRVQSSSFHRGMANNPGVHELYTTGFLTLWREEVTGLAPRERELVILATARALESKFVWNVHLQQADSAGLDESEIAAVFHGRFDDLERTEALLARYVRVLCDMAVTDDLHEDLAEHYDDRQIVGIMVLAGYYTLCCLVADAMGLPTASAKEYVDLSYEMLHNS